MAAKNDHLVRFKDGHIAGSGLHGYAMDNEDEDEISADFPPPRPEDLITEEKDG